MGPLTLTLTLTDTGGAVLALMLGYRSLEKIVSHILRTTRQVMAECRVDVQQLDCAYQGS